MSLRELPVAKTFNLPKNLQWDAPSDVLAQWAEKPMAASDAPNTISIFDEIGEDWWTGAGFTAKRCAAALRSIGTNDVTVQINSPGGDMFEGIAIYNMLREHPAKVTIEIMGWAASAASIIAMAGDEIRMSLGTFMMIHNAWGVVVGNRHDMTEGATLFESFDNAIVDIYEARTGLDRKEIVKLMDAETFMDPSIAVAKGFADKADTKEVSAKASAKNIDRSLMARRQTEAALAKAGLSRNARSELLAELVSSDPAVRDAGRTNATRDAGIDLAAVQQLINTMRS